MVLGKEFREGSDLSCGMVRSTYLEFYYVRIRCGSGRGNGLSRGE